MRYVISVDLEGCACVNGEPHRTLTDSRDYRFACRQASREAAAAASALFDAGADDVIVWDAHGSSLNLDVDILPERVRICAGVQPHGARWGMLDGKADAALLVGYHSRDNVAEATLGHSFSSKEYQYMKIDGVEIGEIGIDGMLLGTLGVPLAFISSDDKGCAEARGLLPNIFAVQTKQALGWNVSLSKHPRAVEKEINEQVTAMAAALRANPASFPTLIPPTDFIMEIRYKRQESAQSAAKRGYERIDAYTCVKRFATLEEAFA